MYSIKDIKEIWKFFLCVFVMNGLVCYYILLNVVKKLRCSNLWKIMGGIMIILYDMRYV